MAAPAPRPSLAGCAPSLVSLRASLRAASRDCLDRHVPQAAKCAAELLAALPPDSAARQRRDLRQQGTSTGTATPHHHHHHGSPHVHFRTSTPVKTPGGSTVASSTPGASGVKTLGAGGPGLAPGRPSLPGLPAHLGVIGGGPGPSGSGAGGGRESLGSVVSMGDASSPVAERSMAGLDDRMPHLASAAAGTGIASAELEQLELYRQRSAERDDDEQDLYALASAYMRSHELLRAAHVLRDCSGGKARWLRTYAKYLAGEKRLQEEAGELLGVKDRPQINPYTQELIDEIASFGEADVVNDAWLLYMQALLFLSRAPTAPAPIHPRGPSGVHGGAASAGQVDERLVALELLTQSVRIEPYNWSAWLRIAECLDGPEELEATLPFLPRCYPLLLFYVHATLEIHSAGDALHDVLDELEGVFGTQCSVITGMRALVHYHVREFDEATHLFESLQQTDPYRLDDVDILSNILYVSEKRAELAALAQEYSRVDRVRPEVCCLVGNYYSLRRDHEKAIVYFRRALKLDRGYLSAWTLMGHEYVEIKNTNAAIASYRRAVDVNRKDYRAWYGLGQTYELLGEPFYALNYYQRATALRPYDARMWSALATCYEKLMRIPDAIRSHQRALLSTEPGDGSDLCLRIGKLYASLGQGAHAAAYHRRALAEGLQSGAGAAEMGRVYLWLVKWEMRLSRGEGAAQREDKGEGGDLEKADEHLRVLEGTQEFRDEAKALRKELEVLLLSRE
ncbi:hypothetical protein Rhopal_006684-T1 [Rhodotorula paludigena]|uniref:Cdc23 domain-containing protein n=1 Tax=Rhodotorula paludigena TaxID=86838 RepID=A0AAV5GWD5_9BASI|nr:hypothetical protein Rhopal_006684-T1 [Rhodotorula paludigena]